MSRRKCPFLVLLVGSVLLTVAPSAEGQAIGSLNRTGSGARAAGMANAFVAVSDDGTAASWNPAGLAQLRRPEASIVVTNVERDVRLDGFLTPDNRARYGDRQTTNATSSLDFVSLAVPFSVAGRAVTVQGGWQHLYELNAEVRGDFMRTSRVNDGPAPLSLRQDRQLSGGIDQWLAAAAVKLSARTALGLSVDFWRGAWDGTDVIAERSNAGGPTDFRALTQISNMRGTNANLGLLLTYPHVNVGLVWHAPFRSRYRQSQLLLASGESTVTAETPPGTRLRFGHGLGLGVAWHPAPRWTLAADLTWDQWSRASIEGLSPEGPINFFDGQPQAVTSTRDTLGVNLGAERLIQRASFLVPVRLGLALEPQGVMDPVLRDPLSYLLVTGGAGLNTNRFKLDMALQYRRSRSRVSEALTLAGARAGLPDAYGVLHQNEWRLRVSAIVRLTETEGLGRVLGKLFGGE